MYVHFLIQILLKKFSKDFCKSTGEKLNEREIKILRQLSASNFDDDEDDDDELFLWYGWSTKGV